MYKMQTSLYLMRDRTELSISCLLLHTFVEVLPDKLGAARHHATFANSPKSQDARLSCNLQVFGVLSAVGMAGETARLCGCAQTPGERANQRLTVFVTELYLLGAFVTRSSHASCASE